MQQIVNFIISVCRQDVKPFLNPFLKDTGYMWKFDTMD